MKKALLGPGLVLIVVLLIAGPAIAVAQASTLLSDDFEGVTKWAPASSGWVVSTSRAYGGTQAAHAPSQFGVQPRLIYGPFDLSKASAAALDFQLWYAAPTATPPPGGAFLLGYSTDGSEFTFPPALQWSGSTGGEWEPRHYDLGGGSFALLGQSHVWLAFGTAQYSALAGYSEGAYLDDVLVSATIPDSTPPVTTVAGIVKGVWYRSAVTAVFSASDAAGSGVDYTEYALDGGDWTKGGSASVSADGPHTLLYRSADLAGNVEDSRSISFGVDTAKPSTRAPSAATAWRGHTAALKYKVLDPAPNGGTAVVTIKIRNRAGTVVKKLGPATRTVNTLLTWKFTVPSRWKAGTYRFTVYAKDRAGNTQALPAGRNDLTVK